MTKKSKNKNAVRLSGGKNFVMINLNLAKVLGDSPAIFFMYLVGQLDKHQDYSTDGAADEWFKVDGQQIYDAIGHSYEKQRRYRDKLEGMGFLEFEAPNRYKLNLDFALEITKTKFKKQSMYKDHKGNCKPKRVEKISTIVEKISTKSEPDGVEKISTIVEKISTHELRKSQPLVEKISTTKNKDSEQNPKTKPDFKGGDNKDNKKKDSSFLRKRTKTLTDRISGEIHSGDFLNPYLGTSDNPKETDVAEISYEVSMDSDQVERKAAKVPEGGEADPMPDCLGTMSRGQDCNICQYALTCLERF